MMTSSKFDLTSSTMDSFEFPKREYATRRVFFFFGLLMLAIFPTSGAEV